MQKACTHLDRVDYTVMPSANGCQGCLATGSQWVHLRMCSTCGHIGCCDSSPNRHATAHHYKTEHPLVRSFEPHEEWFYCYSDSLIFKLEEAPPAPSHT